MSADLVCLFDDLVGVETLLWNRVDDRVKRAHGVPLAWLEVMQVAADTPGCRVLDVAKALAITVGGASKVVDKVEAGGLCRRCPHPTDRRSQLIVLTAAGRRVHQEGSETRAAALAVMLGPAASSRDLMRVAAVLGQVRRHLTAAGPRDGVDVAVSR